MSDADVLLGRPLATSTRLAADCDNEASTKGSSSRRRSTLRAGRAARQTRSSSNNSETQSITERVPLDNHCSRMISHIAVGRLASGLTGPN